MMVDMGGSQPVGTAGAVDLPETALQFLSPDGQVRSAGPYSPYVESLTTDDLRSLYRDMVLTRKFDAEATALQRQGELGLWVPSIGQEAAQVGSAHGLKPQDFAFPGYRDHGVLASRGVDLVQTFAHTRGVDHGGWDPREHNCHLYTLVVGAQTLHATGYAIGIVKDHACATGDPTKDEAVIVYFGDGATSEGDLNEALVFAGVNQAPLVFFCQNNQYAISEPTSRQSRVPLFHRGAGFGIPGVQVDGNDVLACYAVTAAALDAARAGMGPTFIEAFTYRLGAHTTSDDPTRYRDSHDAESWKALDPIARLRLYLTLSDHADQNFFDEVDVEGAALAARAREAVRKLEAPPLDSFFDLAYNEPHPLVAEEHAEWTAFETARLELMGAGR
ncbi:MAG: pyruvate dehydrogenase (acetyl-transferring) E1 component subunit alpha [Propionibacteriaceae bacterium]|nr:pyruvate dehydrogenase (acetyl-transferring) E1 component subunit alpha [Propionibacteriaceae bacterium]